LVIDLSWDEWVSSPIHLIRVIMMILRMLLIATMMKDMKDPKMRPANFSLWYWAQMGRVWASFNGLAYS
jgi:hypothetical protein